MLVNQDMRSATGRRRRRPTVTAAAAVTTLVALAAVAGGCSSSDSGGGDGDASTAKAWVEANVPELPASVVEQACEEGVLSLYALIPPGIAEVNEQFEKDIGCIKVEAFQASGGALAERFSQEQGAGKHNADVIQNFSVAFLDDAAEKGWLEEYTPPNAANVPEKWAHQGYWYGIGLDPMGVFWNTDAVTDEQQEQLSSIETWEQLLDVDGLAGKSAVVDIQAGGTAQLPLYALQDEYGVEYWEALQSQFEPTVFDSITPLTQRLASGNIAVAVDAETTVPGDALAKGAPLQWVYPSPAVGVPQMLGIAAGAPHSAAAKLYMAWSLSKAGLAKWSSANLLSPISDDIEDTRPFADESWFSNPDSANYYEADWSQINEDLADLTTTFDGIFK